MTPTYKWSNNATSSSISVTPNNTTPQIQYVQYSVTVTAGANCSANASVVVQVENVRCGGNGKGIQVCSPSNNNECAASLGNATALLKKNYKIGKCGIAASCPPIQQLILNTLSFDYNSKNEFIVDKTNSVAMYPNPASDEVNFEFENKFSSGSIKIYDLQGRLIVSDKLNPESMTHSVSIKSITTKGIYLAHILLDDETFTEKLIIE